MIKLLLRCPKCSANQNYVNYRLRFKTQIEDRRRACVRCGKSFKIRENVIV